MVAHALGQRRIWIKPRKASHIPGPLDGHSICRNMENPVELESEARANDVIAQQLEAEAFELSKAKYQTWVLKEQQAKIHREAASVLRQRALLARQSSVVSPSLSEGQPLNKREAGYLIDERVDARLAKHARQTVTTFNTIGQDLLIDSHRDHNHFNDLAGGMERVAEQFVNSSLGERLKKQWEATQSQKDIQECLNMIIPELLEQLHGTGHHTSRPTHHNTCETGLRGRSMAIESTICEGSRSMDAHVGTVLEATLSLHALFEAVVGQTWDRVQALQDQQPERGTWRTAVIGKEAFQLWEFRTNRKGWCLQSTSSPLYPFALDTESIGFQFFVRWLATDLRGLGFISPALPRLVAPSSMVIDGIIMGSDASGADELLKERPGVQIFKVHMENNEAAVAKVSTRFRYDVEEFNLNLIQKLSGLKDRTTVLAGTAKLQLGQKVRDALIIKPYAQHIPLDTPFQQLVHHMQHYVGTVGCLYNAGYLHRDLSYSNLLIAGDRAIISDWETMSLIEEQQAAGATGLQTGTPLFAAVSTLTGQPHTLSSELETLFNVMLYILSGGVLHWQRMEQDNHQLITVRRGVMIMGEFERTMLKRVDRACWPALQRLRALFFPNGGSSYRTDVCCQDFLNAL